MARKRTFSKERATRGRVALAAYIQCRDMDSIEAKQDYTITDCIADLMHYAASRRFDVDGLIRSAENHFECETEGGEE